jgi:rhomboid protease GluP
MPSQKNPREENFFDFLKFSCCPTFKWFSFIPWITVFNIVYFIVALSISKTIGGEFLQPDIAALVNLGAKYPYKMQAGEVFRFITPCLLHANFMHIISNSVSVLIFGMSLESSLGTLKLIALYVIAGIGGNLFSSLVADTISVGASTCIFGLLGGQLAYLIINWEALASLGQMRCQMLLVIIFIILINLLVGVGHAQNIDNYGHIGGFFSGLFSSFFLVKPIENTPHVRKLQLSGIILNGLYFVIGFVCFFTIVNTRNYNI